MKSLTLVLLFLLPYCWSNAQEDAILKGNWFLEANARLSGTTLSVSNPPSTGFGLVNSDGTTLWTIGGEGGYFIMDNLAIKLGLGYTDFDGFSSFTYKLGGRYYVADVIPLQIDLTGSSIEDDTANPLWVGIQGGYALFLNDNVALEPSLRYNVNLNEDFSDTGFLELLIGFAVYFGGK